MSDFTDIENELKKLQPAQLSAGFLARVENAVVDLAEDNKIIRPDRFRINWLSLGIGLAAAASLLIFARLQFDNPSSRQPQIAANSPAPIARSTSTSPASEFLPAGATQVVYNTRDEGLHFPSDSGEPMRRVRSHLHETLQWRNAATGSSLRVSYPSEEVELIPISGQ